jgi:hypothetical protein
MAKRPNAIVYSCTHAVRPGRARVGNPCYGIGGFICALLITSFAFASAQHDLPPIKSDVSGTWKWSMQRRNGRGIPVVLSLKQDGEKLTGTISGWMDHDAEIQEGTIKNGKISFKVIRERNDETYTTIYTGQLEGDKISGKIESDMWGQNRVRKWDAMREADETAKK